MPAAKDEPLLRIQDVANRWMVSTRTVEREIARGRLNPIRIGGQRRFSIQQIHAYERRRVLR